MPGSVEQENGTTIKAEVLSILATPDGANLTVREIRDRIGRGDHGAIGRIVRQFRLGPVPLAIGEVREVPLAGITVDPRVPFRDHVDDAAVDDYAEVWRAGDATFPPVVVFREGDVDWLGGGLHRYLSAVKAEMASIRAEVREGTLRDAILFAAGDNVRNGIRKTRADRRAGVMALLRGPEFSGMTIEEIADHCDVSGRTVSNCKRDLNLATCVVDESEPTVAIWNQDDSPQRDASDRYVPSDDRSSAVPALDGPDDDSAEDDIDDSMGANPEDDTEDDSESPDAAPSAHANGHPKGANGTAARPQKAREPGEDDEKAKERRDREYLATMTIRDKLSPRVREVFDRDALACRDAQEAVEALRARGLAGDRKTGVVQGAWQRELSRFLMWSSGHHGAVKCMGCTDGRKGDGSPHTGPDSCNGLGYHLAKGRGR